MAACYLIKPPTMMCLAYWEKKKKKKNLQMELTVTNKLLIFKIEIWNHAFMNRLTFASIFFHFTCFHKYILKNSKLLSLKCLCVVSLHFCVHLVVFWPIIYTCMYNYFLVGNVSRWSVCSACALLKFKTCTFYAWYEWASEERCRQRWYFVNSYVWLAQNPMQKEDC